MSTVCCGSKEVLDSAGVGLCTVCCCPCLHVNSINMHVCCNSVCFVFITYHYMFVVMMPWSTSLLKTKSVPARSKTDGD